MFTKGDGKHMHVEIAVGANSHVCLSVWSCARGAMHIGAVGSWNLKDNLEGGCLSDQHVSCNPRLKAPIGKVHAQPVHMLLRSWGT